MSDSLERGCKVIGNIYEFQSTPAYDRHLETQIASMEAELKLMVSPSYSGALKRVGRDVEADLMMCEAATPGPWKVYSEDLEEREFYPPAHYPVAINAGKESIVNCDGINIELPECHANAKFIAEARTALPHWIQRAIEAKADVERLRKQHHGDRIELNRRIMKLETENKRQEKLVEALRTIQAESDDWGARECAAEALVSIEST